MTLASVGSDNTVRLWLANLNGVTQEKATLESKLMYRTWLWRADWTHAQVVRLGGGRRAKGGGGANDRSYNYRRRRIGNAFGGHCLHRRRQWEASRGTRFWVVKFMCLHFEPHLEVGLQRLVTVHMVIGSGGGSGGKTWAYVSSSVDDFKDARIIDRPLHLLCGLATLALVCTSVVGSANINYVRCTRIIVERICDKEDEENM